VADPAKEPVGGGVVAELAAVVDRLAALPGAVDDAERIDRIQVLERLRGAVAAAQAVETTAFAASQLAAQAAAGVPRTRRGRGIPEQIGLARKLSPATATRQVIFAETLTRDTPAILDLLRRGDISEWSAQITTRETTGLPRHLRRAITDDLAPDLPAMGPRQIEAATRRAAYTADPRAIMARARTARSDRRVSIRPAPDTMALLSGFVPAEQGIAAWATLQRHAQAAKSGGDPRTLGQIMADTLITRLTGQDTPTAIPVEIGVTMTLDTLTDHSEEPAHLHNYGPLPADLARNLIPNAPTTPPTSRPTNPRSTDPNSTTVHTADQTADHTADHTADQLNRTARGTADDPATDPATGTATGTATATTTNVDGSSHGGSDGGADGGSIDDVRVDAWLRRIITDPLTNTVITVDPRRRRFPPHLARLIRYRDQTCRDPYCTAPIRHLDHTHPHNDGGPTTAHNGAGLCERGNYTKDMPGWTRRSIASPDPTIDTTDGTTDGTASGPRSASGSGPASSPRERADATALGVVRADPNPATRPETTIAPTAGSAHVIEITTPTGHRYSSTAPPVLGPGSNTSELDRRTVKRRMAHLGRERLIASLPSPNKPSAALADGATPDEPP
jgi:uncharacterized protein DUF222